MGAGGGGMSVRPSRWKMSPSMVRQVHAIARRQKGLNEETYRMRLGAVGVESSKDFTRRQYHDFMRGLTKLPDANQPLTRMRA